MVTVEEHLQYWLSFIESLEEQSLIDDVSEAYEMEMVYFSAREALQKNALTHEQQQQLQELDARFRAAFGSALRGKASVIACYKQWGAERPKDFWWWHVEV